MKAIPVSALDPVDPLAKLAMPGTRADYELMIFGFPLTDEERNAIASSPISITVNT